MRNFSFCMNFGKKKQSRDGLRRIRVPHSPQKITGNRLKQLDVWILLVANKNPFHHKTNKSNEDFQINEHKLNMEIKVVGSKIAPVLIR